MHPKYAQQLMRSLDLDDEPEQVLSDRRFLKEDLFALFLEACDSKTFEEPKTGLRLAEVAAGFAERLAEVSPEKGPLLRARAAAVLGAAHRAAGDFGAAHRVYEQALSYEIPPLDRAEIYRRQAYLCMVERRAEDALRLINEALRIHRLEGDLTDRHLLGRCLLARGQIEYEVGDASRSVVDVSASLNHLSCKRQSIYYQAALHALAVSLVDHGSPKELSKALYHLRHAYRRLGSIKKPHLARFKLKWLQGLVHARYDATARAEIEFRAARDGFIKLGLAHDTAMVSLDLGLVLLRTHRTTEVEKLARETYRLFQNLSDDRDSLAALLMWSQARVLDFTLLHTARQTLARCVQLRPLEIVRP